MPTLKELIKRKAERLRTVPESFASRVKKSERQVYNRIIELLAELEVSGGDFVSSSANLRIATEITSLLKSTLTDTDYIEAVTEFASEFDEQLTSNLNYFKKAFDLKALPDLATAVAEQGKRNAVDLLLNTAAESEFLKPLAEIIETSVIQGAGYKDTLEAIQDFVLGNEDVESRLLRYSKQVATDSFAVSDAEVSSVAADELEAEWFLYAGEEIPTTRPFCDERTGRYFHYLEIEAWGRGEKTLGMETPQGGEWDGMNRDTNAQTIYAYRGGYNCRHALMPVSIFIVPKEDIQRAITQGYFTPSEFEVQELGL
jgi:hypothetical protein